MSSMNGRTKTFYAGILARIQLAAHKNCCKSCTVAGSGISIRARILSGSWETPFASMMRPHHFDFLKQSHLGGLSFNPVFRHVSSTTSNRLNNFPSSSAYPSNSSNHASSPR
jgi:hypothetical protein